MLLNIGLGRGLPIKDLLITGNVVLSRLSHSGLSRPGSCSSSVLEFHAVSGGALQTIAVKPS